MKPKPMTVAQADAMFEHVAASLGPPNESALYAQLLKALRHAPRESNPQTWARSALRLYLHSHSFIEECQHLPAPVIRSFFEQLPREHTRNGWSVFLRLAVDLELPDSLLEKAWEAALQCQVALFVTHAKGAASRRSKLPAIVKNQALLRAIQATVVSERAASEGELVVLTHDASEESLDALMPIFERAIAEKDSTLDQIRSLKEHASHTPELDAMFARVEALFHERAQKSPGLAFAAKSLGLEGIDAIYFQAVVRSLELTDGGVPRVLSTLRVDSRKTPWFTVSTMGVAGAGPAEPSEWPKWLAQVARRKKVEWNVKATYVSGKHRARILKWVHS